MVCILLGEGFEESEVIVPLDLMRRAGLEVALVGLGGEEEVISSHKVAVRTDMTIDDVHLSRTELVMIPGGMGGVAAIKHSDAAKKLILRAFEKGIYLAAICAGPTVLAELGLLSGRMAVCYPGMEAELGDAVVCKGKPVVSDGSIITGEAAGSSFAFGLKLIEILKGPAAAAQVKLSVHDHG